MCVPCNSIVQTALPFFSLSFLEKAVRDHPTLFSLEETAVDNETGKLIEVDK